MKTTITAPSMYTIWGSLALLFCVERLTKYFAHLYVPDEGLLATPRAFGFVVEQNQGVAFSFALPDGVLSILFGCIVFILLVLHFRARQRIEKVIMWGTGLIIIGAVSNFIDRIQFGGVTDFIRIFPWPTFNLADLFILCGVSILLLFYYRAKREK